MKTKFFFWKEPDAEQFKAELDKALIESVVTHRMVEIPNHRCFNEGCIKDILGMAQRICSAVTCDYEAHKKLQQMTLEECIEYWNESVCDHYCRNMEIFETDDEDKWEWFAKGLGAYYLAVRIANSDDFKMNKLYSVYLEEGEQFASFNTKEELIELIGEDWFIDNFMNEE